MSFTLNDNIVAISSSSSSFDGALSIIRISGKDLSKVWVQLTKKKSYKPRFSYLINIKNKKNILIDSAVCVFFESPKSFTGQDVIEITCHGGRFVAENLMTYLFSLNLRQASKGEFSYRAFINGKIDLLQAESISELIVSGSSIAAEHSSLGLQGRLSKKINLFKKNIIDLITIIEHELDFLEDEIDFTAIQKIKDRIKQTHEELKSLYDYSYSLQSYASEFRVSIVGPPNVGKSTIFNAIVGEAKALVSSTRGTTRDSIDALVKINENLSITLTDTAGVWSSKNKLDRMGVEKTKTNIEKSNLLIVVDSSLPSSFFNKSFLKNKKTMRVLSKKDLHGIESSKETLSICSKNKKDINILLTSLTKKIYFFYPFFNAGEALFTSRRQLVLMERALSSLEGSLGLVGSGASLDIVVSSLYDFVNILKEVLGEVSEEDVLYNIFDSFCVGK